MERKKYLITLLYLLFLLSGMASNKAKIYSAYINDDMQQWKTVIDRMEQEANNSPQFLSKLVNYQYGYIGWCIGTNRSDEAEIYLERAEENLEKLEDLNYNPSEINAYKSAFYGFKIGISAFKAPFLGPKSVKHAELAMEQAESNPLGYIQYGNSQFYMPPVFGGSKKVALEYYEQALKIMERDSAQLKNNWNYLSLLTQIAQAHQVMENYNAAESVYQKILKAEPQFNYVKNELYPQFLKERNENE